MTDNNPYSTEVPDLYTEHLEHLKKSAISVEVIQERGYRTIARLSRHSVSGSTIPGAPNLSDLGFSKKQLRAPGILMPVHGTDGTIVGYQYRPDRPRTDDNFRPIKYESPTGSSVHLDVPPRCRPLLGNPNLPIHITEGIKKADSLATKGVCAVGLMGVWGFKGTNAFGGKTIVADFEYIAWNNRLVYLVFDSDIISKASVQMALNRLAEHLKRKQAYVRVLQLPPGPDGEKVGVDDFFVQGHTIEDLIACEQVIPAAMRSLKERSNHLYTIDQGCICLNKPGETGDDVIPLANFFLRITEDIIKDNGKDTTRHFKIGGLTTDNKMLRPVIIPVSTFKSLGWITEAWGTQAVVYAGSNTQDHLRVALLLQSKDEAIQKTVFTHTGWREINGKMAYLTNAGAIGEKNIMVEMEDALINYNIPEPVGDAANPALAMQRSLAFLDIANKREVTLPLLAMMYLAPLCSILDPAFTLWYNGQTGSFKSTIISLALNHFGFFSYHSLPANWSSTENNLETLLFLCKDAPMVIDDFAPGSNSYQARQLEGKAERIVRSQGNKQSRGRNNADNTTQSSHPPRGLLISSGEQLPGGESRNARIFTVDIEREDIDKTKLTEAQHNTHFYRAAMYHYLLWLREQYPDLSKTLIPQWEKLRDEFQGANIHPRLPDVTASLYIGLSKVIGYAVSINAINKRNAANILKEGKDCFIKLAVEQGKLVEELRPGKRFLAAIRSLLATGTARLRDREETGPPTPVPGQSIIGWDDLQNGHILLDPEMSMMVVKRFYQNKEEPFTIKDRAVFHDLKRLGYTDCDKDRRDKVERFGKDIRRVIAVKRNIVDIDMDGGENKGQNKGELG